MALDFTSVFGVENWSSRHTFISRAQGFIINSEVGEGREGGPYQISGTAFPIQEIKISHAFGVGVASRDSLGTSTVVEVPVDTGRLLICVSRLFK